MNLFNRYPLVSIGLPIYNAASSVDRVISDLLAQDYPNIQIIVSDNASTDNTFSLCQEYAQRDSRIRVYQNANNLGPRANFKRVLEESNGKYFMWAAHDDTHSSNYITSLVNVMRQNWFPILAAPTTQQIIVHLDQTETLRPSLISAPPSKVQSKRKTAFLIAAQKVSNWIYGLYDRKKLVRVIHKLVDLPYTNASDICFLLHLCLNYRVVGSGEAILYRKSAMQRRSYEPTTETELMDWLEWFDITVRQEVKTAWLFPRDRKYLKVVFDGMISKRQETEIKRFNELRDIQK